MSVMMVHIKIDWQFLLLSFMDYVSPNTVSDGGGSENI